jgi:hypothetical protein
LAKGAIIVILHSFHPVTLREGIFSDVRCCQGWKGGREAGSGILNEPGVRVPGQNIFRKNFLKKKFIKTTGIAGISGKAILYIRIFTK